MGQFEGQGARGRIDSCLEHALDAARRRLRRLGARPGRRDLDLDDLIQDTAAAIVERLAERTPRTAAIDVDRIDSLTITVASNKARDRWRASGRAPEEDVAEDLDEVELRPVRNRRAGEVWRTVCANGSDLGSDARRVVVMRQGLTTQWTTIAFIEARRSEAARSVYYRGRDGLRRRPDGGPRSRA